MNTIPDWALAPEASLYIQPDGSVQGLYTELIDLRALSGRVKVRTLSSIDWDEDAQVWRVVCPDGTELGRYRTRQEALIVEREHFGKLMEEAKL